MIDRICDDRKMTFSVLWMPKVQMVVCITQQKDFAEFHRILLLKAWWFAQSFFLLQSSRNFPCNLCIKYILISPPPPKIHHHHVKKTKFTYFVQIFLISNVLGNHLKFLSSIFSENHYFRSVGS